MAELKEFKLPDVGEGLTEGSNRFVAKMIIGFH